MKKICACVVVGGEKSDRQATRSRFFSNMHHRHGLKANCSVGERAIAVMMKGSASAGLSARERVCTFYLRTSLKGDSAGLAWKTTASWGLGGKGGGGDGTRMCTDICIRGLFMGA